MSAMTTVADDRLAELDRKVDVLTEQLAFLAERARAEQGRRERWEELVHDLTPIARQAYETAAAELADVQEYATTEDLARIAKLVLRNTRTIERMVLQLESMHDLVGEVMPLGRDAFVSLTNKLDDLERRGYMTFVKGGAEVADRIVTSFSEDDIHQLGDNVVLILQTVKEMTQPEVMTMLQRAAVIAREEEPEQISLLALLRRMNDPAVKRGLDRVLRVLQGVAGSSAQSLQTPATSRSNHTKE